MPADPVVRYVVQTLIGALRETDAHVAVFGFDPPSELELFCTTDDLVGASEVETMEQVARAGLLSRTATRVDDLHAVDRAFLALPATIGDNRVAEIVVHAPHDQIVAVVELLRPHLMSIAVSVDRHRVLRALDRRGAEIASVRQQLGAYAVDVQSSYRAERDRAVQLALALSELEQTYLATVEGLAIAVEAKDENTGGHLQRVSRYGMMLTELVAPDHANDPQFEYGFLLHDIGKLTVPDVVLRKPGPLDDDEWRVMRGHPTSGQSILAGIPFLAGAREIVFAHHERWDGRGYPNGLAGQEIPLGAQIFPICDAFDAMTSDRPYRSAMPVAEAFAEVRRARGGQFWPEAVDAFLDLPVDAIETVMTTAQQGVFH